MWSSGYSWQILIKYAFFSTDFRKILKYEISYKFVQGESSYSTGELFYRQADMTKVIVDFRNFAKWPKNTNLKLFSKYFE
jgi:hypothetical protein